MPFDDEVWLDIGSDKNQVVSKFKLSAGNVQLSADRTLGTPALFSGITVSSLIRLCW